MRRSQNTRNSALARIGAWRAVLIALAFLFAVLCILPSFPSYYGPMFGYLSRSLQAGDGVAAPTYTEEGFEFMLGADQTKTLRSQYRDFANTARARARAVGLTNVTVNGAAAAVEDAARVQNKAVLAYEDPQNRTPEQILQEMQLFGKIPSSLRWLFPDAQMNLGLDLKGGVYLVLELDMEEAQEQTLEQLQITVKNDLRDRFLVNCKEVQRDGNVLTVLIQPRQSWGSENDAKKPDVENYLNEIEAVRAEPVNDGMPGGDGIVSYRLEIDPNQFEEREEQALAQVLEVLRSRVDAFGVSEPEIRRQPNRPRIIVQLPGASDSSTAVNVVKTMGILQFRMVKERNDRPWLGSQSPPEADEIPDDSEALYDADGLWYVVEKQVQVAGGDLTRAGTSINHLAEIVVTLKFNSAGRRAFAETTTSRTNESIAIVLDGAVVSAPNINEPIRGGEATISGGFTQAEASDLARILRAGAFPVGVKIAEERTVGPSLGRDAIVKGARAAALGMAIVLLFVIFFYNLCGFFSWIALALNGLLILAALATLNATLTLPGLAGLVLTIGMAVDANVLINERIKEELKAGNTVMNSINAGYSRVFWTIVDANVTTFLTALVLYMFGSGAVKGFGVTLMIGIVCTMFTALFVTRAFYRLYETRQRTSLPIHPLVLSRNSSRNNAAEREAVG